MEQKIVEQTIYEAMAAYKDKVRSAITITSIPMFLELRQIIQSFNRKAVDNKIIRPVPYTYHHAYTSGPLVCVADYKAFKMDDGLFFELFMVSSELGFYCFLVEGCIIHIYDMSDFKEDYYKNTSKFNDIFYLFCTNIVPSIICSNIETCNILLNTLNNKEDFIRRNTNPPDYRSIMKVFFEKKSDDTFIINNIVTKHDFNLFDIDDIKKITSIESIIYAMVQEPI